MRELKSDIIHAIYQCSGIDNEKLVEVSNICDEFQSRLDKSEALKPSHNSAIMQLLGRFLTLESKWMDYAGPVAVFHELCAEARRLGATAQ